MSFDVTQSDQKRKASGLKYHKSISLSWRLSVHKKLASSKNLMQNKEEVQCRLRRLGGKKCHACTCSTKQKKPNRECMTECILLLFHMHSCSRFLSIRYPFRTCSLCILFCFCSVSVPLVSALGTRSKERGLRELV